MPCLAVYKTVPVHASQTHISCTFPSKPCTRTVFVAGRAVRLATDSKTANANGSSIRPWFSAQRERAATFLSDDSSEKRLVQLHDRLPRGSQAAWRRSRLINVADDQCGAVEHKHTYIHVLPHGHVTNGDLSAALVGEDG